ncbi:hypothetical protein GCM10008927_10790 [Amylibacter ulvae]|uniref:Right handed beta helix domain-containing protein n=1 Tax=Paramylibacter ulvae TaxID=1651968 RepID=A0ABQ3CX67_9RHOB|nr:right-handed parallel beta-helix repeat-containing protein [Amylibacter ulvae]GHA47710.1 hypothetical protein GCM10008927_10790 [Amylibacter ulvae]
MARIDVSNASQLNAALSSANSGDTIVLAAGNYGNVNINSKDFGSGVTITSASNNNPANFSGLTINNVDGLTLDNVLLDYTYSNGHQLHQQPFRITNSSNVEIVNSEISGDTAPGSGVGTAYGLVVNDSDNVTVENTEIHTFFRGAVFERVDNLNVIENDVHSIRSDGMDYAQVTNVLIEGNYFHDFDAEQNTADHRDMIQFWTTNTSAPSANVTIRGNNFDIGDGSWTESIFIHNERVTNEGAGQSMYYQNFLIENNTIYNAHYHGITVGATDGLTIRNNTVLQAVGDPNATGNPGRDPGVTVPHIHLIDRPQNVTITGNVTNGITADYGLNGHNVSGNVIIDPRNYDDYFTAGSLNAGSPHSFIPITGSAVDGVGATVEEPVVDPGEPDDNGNLNIEGNSRDNVLTGDVGADRIRGNDGDDVLYGGEGRDRLDGGDGDDMLYAGANTVNNSAEYLRGRDGDDTYMITKSDNHTTILDETEDSGYDRIVFSDFNLDGFNEISVNSAENMVFAFTNEADDSAKIVVRNFDCIEELEFADGTVLTNGNTLNDINGDNFLFGTNEADSLRGRDGNDLLIGGDGRDNLNGGDGDDILSAGGNTDGRSASEYLRGLDGDDTYIITHDDYRPYITGESNTNAGGHDVIRFQDFDIDDFDRIWIDNNNRLNFSFDNAHDQEGRLTVSSHNNIEEFVFADGTVVTDWHDLV